MNGPVSLAEFRARFPEFVSADDTLIQSFLDAAILRLGSAWGALKSEGHLYLTAMLLDNAPNGQMARLQSKEAESTYSAEYKSLERRVTCLLRVF